MGFVIHTSARFDESHPDALAIYCADGRFTDSVEELLRHLGHSRLDHLTPPGGPGLFDPFTASWNERSWIKEASDFLIVGHKIKSVVLIAHEGCGFYKKRWSSMAPEHRHARQIADTKVAVPTLMANEGVVDVSMFYATPVDSAQRPAAPRPRVSFEQIGWMKREAVKREELKWEELR